jgi:osmotically-inducible protein OsmY
VKKLLSTLVLVVAIAGLSQAASVATPNAVVVKPVVTKPAVAKPQPVVAKVPDAQIERTIRAKFGKSKINVEHFTVSVKDGIATIDGKTNVIQHKGVATRLARTGGALAVQNHIQISEEARAKAAAKLAKYRTGDTQLARATVIPAAKPKVN